MRELDLEAVPMIGVVKPPQRHNEVAYILVKGREDEPIYLDPHSQILRLMQMIRDETHRYAVTYHRKRRELRDFTSELTRFLVSARSARIVCSATWDRFNDRAGRCF